jgi:hypothetical protein
MAGPAAEAYPVQASAASKRSRKSCARSPAAIVREDGRPRMSYLEYSVKTTPTGLRKVLYLNWPLASC